VGGKRVEKKEGRKSTPGRKEGWEGDCRISNKGSQAGEGKGKTKNQVPAAEKEPLLQVQGRASCGRTTKNAGGVESCKHYTIISIRPSLMPVGKEGIREAKEEGEQNNFPEGEGGGKSKEKTKGAAGRGPVPGKLKFPSTNT